MSAVSITAASVLASATGIQNDHFTAGATLTRGMSAYLNTSSQWVPTDSNAAATGNGVTDKRGIVLTDAASGQPVIVLERDSDLTLGGTLVAGESYYAGQTPGAIIPSSDLATGDWVVFLGVAKSTTKLNYAPLAAGAQHA